MSLHIFLGVMKCSCILLCEYKSLKFKFEFKLICNLQNRFEKEKEFLNWKSASGRIQCGPAIHRARGLGGATGGAAALWITSVKPTW
jgi:hypothetical protein